ncbi:Flp pilus assembly complex ATPase component TadA [Loktanella sp. TSTF-M6]|uniref:Flp pilus assembly complex ATPase component TadA n=1 Tax=Loktanella gaetbuli TaxID=2881335 RepID=A0ABS8BXX1_9RHOB|nr:ATPase, T2SS/T4P/T4SS family [Loktanella gaetbuli]MCB5200591.1 Flp pilus assembly complex ATPase component TadA [Loktanella gaetbuli]
MNGMLDDFAVIGASESDDEVFARYHAQVIQGLLGPIAPYYGDPEEKDPERRKMADSVQEIMINGPDEIYVELSGKLTRLPGASFGEPENLTALARAILQYAGKRLDPNDLSIEARTPEKHRVHIVQAPAARPGLSMAIRKFPKDRISLDMLREKGSFSAAAQDYLRVAMEQRRNLLVSGGTGSGKTTILNALSEMIAPDDRVLIIEDTTEIRFEDDRHVLQLEAQKPTEHGDGGISIRDLLKGSLRMRPDRVIVGECRAGEALDMVQAMNTGHAGSMSTVHANSPVDCLARVETLCLMSGVDMPLVALQRQIAAAVEVVVQISRVRGFRRVVEISEVRGLDPETNYYQMAPIFNLQPDKDGPNGKSLMWTGEMPTFPELLPEEISELTRLWQK